MLVHRHVHLQHAPLQGNCDLSYAQSESNVDNEFKDGLDELPLDTHEDFIQYGHNENVAIDYQWPQPVYAKLKEGCQHGIDKSYHFTLNFQAIDFLSGVEFNEEKVFSKPKEKRHLQQEVPWMVSFIFEDNEIVGEQQKTSLRFYTDV
jgi:hypothetical protein